MKKLIQIHEMISVIHKHFNCYIRQCICSYVHAHKYIVMFSTFTGITVQYE